MMKKKERKLKKKRKTKQKEKEDELAREGQETWGVACTRDAATVSEHVVKTLPRATESPGLSFPPLYHLPTPSFCPSLFFFSSLLFSHHLLLVLGSTPFSTSPSRLSITTRFDYCFVKCDVKDSKTFSLTPPHCNSLSLRFNFGLLNSYCRISNDCLGQMFTAIVN